MTYAELRDTLAAIAGHCDVVGLDLVEVNPTLDVGTGITSYLGAHTVLEFLANICRQPRWEPRREARAARRRAVDAGGPHEPSRRTNHIAPRDSSAPHGGPLDIVASNAGRARDTRLQKSNLDDQPSARSDGYHSGLVIKADAVGFKPGRGEAYRWRAANEIRAMPTPVDRPSAYPVEPQAANGATSRFSTPVTAGYTVPNFR